MLKKIYDVLNDSQGISDPRMNKFLTKSPLELITVVTLYLTIIYKIGPKFMKNREAFSLKPLLIIYNVTQIVANYIFFLQVSSLWESLNVWCTPHDRSNSETSLRTLRCHYFYILLKYFDLIETILFVLRKKDSQVSFLHVHHHVGMLLAAFISGKYFPGGQALFVGIYNSGMHIIMYCYYLLTSVNSKYISAWWKKYVTLLQIIQLILIVLSFAPSILNPSCSYPKGWSILFTANVILNIHLFIRFYRRAYLKKNRTA